LLEVSMGPQHPSTHGVFRMDVVLDGERVVKLKPVFGYLHRNHEKIAENETYLGSMPYTDRLDYFCSITNNWAYALAVEKLAGIVVPERAEYLRVITGELTRLQNHACLVGFLMQDMGASGTPLMYAFREREKILDLFEALTGARMMCNYMRFGGCRVDMPAGWLEGKRSCRRFPAFSMSSSSCSSGNEILMARTQGVGVLAKRTGHQRRRQRPDGCAPAASTTTSARSTNTASTTASLPRAAGRPRRRLRPLHDPLARDARVVKILEQAMRDIPGGPIVDPKTKIRGFRPKPGEAYGASNRPRASLASTSSATARPIPIATACVRPA
jgi:NADH-quinone oxidoreductase subunit D